MGVCLSWIPSCIFQVQSRIFRIPSYLTPIIAQICTIFVQSVPKWHKPNKDTQDLKDGQDFEPVILMIKMIKHDNFCAISLSSSW